MNSRETGFTLIELLIVVAIIAVLAAIAVPNFLEAQTRAKTSRVHADLRSLATAIQAFRTDHEDYPIGTDDPPYLPAEIVGHFSASAVATGASPPPFAFYAFRTVDIPGTVEGHGLTTPIAYISSIPMDPFSSQPACIPYSYREGRDGDRTGWILTSFGPDGDDLENGGKNNACGDLRAFLCGRHGDISEVHALPGSGRFAADIGMRLSLLAEASYDPTNGTTSSGDIWRIGP